VLGLAGSGLHTNGYSLARGLLAASGLALEAPLPGGAGERVGEALLAPHRWYGPALMPLVDKQRVHALAHVTGGGIAGNLVRVLPAGARARVRPDAWPRPAVFRWLVEAGGGARGRRAQWRSIWASACSRWSSRRGGRGDARAHRRGRDRVDTRRHRGRRPRVEWVPA
jgi:phosphoribosylaminoimidazole (AIR) synthetase